jgi:hypothetical protein
MGMSGVSYRRLSFALMLAVPALAYGIGGAEAGQRVNITQRQSPAQLKQSCDNVGGNYSTQSNGGASCHNPGKKTLVSCDKDGHCTGIVPE